MPETLSALLQRPPLGWWDLLDIAIVSILIYEFLKLIRGTRAVQMARPAGDDLSAAVAAARRGGHRAGKPRRRGRLLPAADRSSRRRLNDDVEVQTVNPRTKARGW
jgi:hypothetical protein